MNSGPLKSPDYIFSVTNVYYVLYVNDLPNATRHCSVLMYADDTVLFCAGKDASTIENELNNEIISLGAWLQENRLFLNTVKT